MYATAQQYGWSFCNYFMVLQCTLLIFHLMMGNMELKGAISAAIKTFLAPHPRTAAGSVLSVQQSTNS
jgi:hypothetical protein